ncbi:MAG: AsmA family protein [Candidatus Omnitrophota bacterium]|nr:AsmA family protein [Candidatus Omnitrophota bacterium]
MKIILVVVLVMVVVAIGAGAVLLLQFDPNDLKPSIEQTIGDAVGAKAQLGYISVRWGIDMQFEISGVELRDPKSDEILLKTGSATAGFNLRGLLNKEVSIPFFELHRPEIYIRKSRTGQWNWQPKQPGAEPGLSSAWVVFISSVRVHEGKLHYQDESYQMPFVIQVDHIEFTMRQQSFGAPLRMNGSAGLFGSRQPNLNIDGVYDHAIGILVFKAVYGPDKVVLEGEISNLASQPQFKGNLNVHQLDLESVTPAEMKDREYLTGILTAKLEGSAEGTHPDMLKRTLAMQGAVDVRNGAFKNINFISRVLSQLTPIPGLGQILLERVPEELTPVMQGEDTPFELLKANFQILQSRAFLTGLQVKHEHYMMEADGSAGLLQQDVDFRAKLVMLEYLSQFLLKKVKELAVVKNQQGRIVLPFVYRGLLPNATVQPDLNYLSRQLFQERGQELVQVGLGKLAELLGEPSGEAR